MYALLKSNPENNTRRETPDLIIDRGALLACGVHRIDDGLSIHCDLSDEGLEIALWKDDPPEPEQLESRKLSWEEIRGLLSDRKE